jgi:hypothetical protein
MVHAIGDEISFQRTKSLSTETLSPFGLSWDDVEDIMPLHDTLNRFLKRRSPQSNNHRHGWICRGKSASEVEEAFKLVFIRHPIMRSMAIEYDQKLTLHLIMRPSDRFFSHCFTHLDPVRGVDDLKKLAYNDSTRPCRASRPNDESADHSRRRTQQHGNNLFMPAFCLRWRFIPMFLEDFDTYLRDPKASLAPRPPYKAWADTFHSLRDSAEAKKATNWHARRLAGIEQHRNALFPPQKAPEWFKGNSEGWIDLSTGKPGPAQKSLGSGSDGVMGCATLAHIPDALALRSKYKIEVPQIMKGALALVNVRHNNTNVAFFGQYQAARTWPFLPDWQAKRMPNAMDIAGPTLQFMLAKASIESEDTVLELLSRLQEDQREYNK